MEINITEKVEKLKKISNFIRGFIILSTTFAGSGHPGGSLSSTDIITALYFYKLRHNPKDPKWDERDRFVLSKGHCAPALYSALALCGYFEIEKLKDLRKFGSILQGHPDALKVPGIEASTGSLGQGLSIGIGMALASKLNEKKLGKGYETYVLLGDGECDEGQIWEGFMAASNFARKGRCGNLTVIIDRNRLQIDGSTESVMELEPLAEKINAFGWETIEINGHNFEEIINALDKEHNSKPKAIIANTIKGKGVKFMENEAKWHGRAPDFWQCIEALKDLQFVNENEEMYKEIKEYKDKKNDEKIQYYNEKMQKYCINKFDEICGNVKIFIKNENLFGLRCDNASGKGSY